VYLSFARRGNTVLDVGANVGAHAVFLSHIVGENGRVLAFEPLAENIDALRETIRRRSRFANISIFPFAVGNPGKARQDVVMKAPGADLTQASLELQRAGLWEQKGGVREYKVSLTSLDAEREVQALPSINFIKIDVEGGELDVLKGAARTISTHRPLIYCEVYERWAESFRYTPADLFEFLRTLGYENARVISRGHVRPFSFSSPVPPGMFDESSDVLFFANKHSALVSDFDRRYLDQ
jgi:FkbM family methyltransferase